LARQWWAHPRITVRRLVSGDIILIPRMPARLTAITARSGSLAACSWALGRGTAGAGVTDGAATVAAGMDSAVAMAATVAARTDSAAVLDAGRTAAEFADMPVAPAATVVESGAALAAADTLVDSVVAAMPVGSVVVATAVAAVDTGKMGGSRI